jgi:hypothetical protein
MKTELEEAAEKYAEYQLKGIVDKSSKFECVNDFIAGAKDQAERMYSEAIEFGKWLDENIQQREYWPMGAMTMEELFEQFKKK